MQKLPSEELYQNLILQFKNRFKNRLRTLFKNQFVSPFQNQLRSKNLAPCILLAHQPNQKQVPPKTQMSLDFLTLEALFPSKTVNAANVKNPNAFCYTVTASEPGRSVKVVIV